MGHKIITEKDFWICTEGMVPAQMQSTQKVAVKKTGERYITVRDTSTSSWIDFSCTKGMLLNALIAAVVAVVIVAAVVTTGGAALLAVGLVAGLAGGLITAVKGALDCGQKMAPQRVWIDPKPDLVILGAEAITGDCTMTCPKGGTVKFAPEIKNWWQAAGVGAANFVIKMAECGLVGAGVGAAAPAVIPLFTGGATLGIPTAASVFGNFAGSFTGVFGALRAVSALDQLPNQIATGDSARNMAKSAIFGALPEVELAHRIRNHGSLRPSDAMMLLYLLHIKAKAPTEAVAPKEESARTPEEEPIKSEEETAAPVEEAPASENAAGEGEFEAFEDPANVDGVPESAMTGRKPASPEYPVFDANGNLSEYGKWYYERPSGYRDGVRDTTWDNAVAESIDGQVRDPQNGDIVLDPNEPWDMGHRPGYEFRKHQVSAARRGISRKQFMDEHNNPDHFRPEDPISNQGHQGEAPDDVYHGP